MRMLLAILLSAAALPAQTDGVISGTVRNAASHLPLEGVEVGVNHELPAVQTDARGAFRFAGLPEGSYTLNLQKPGFSLPAPLKVDTHSGPVTVELYPLAQIEGRVLDEDGAPVAGVDLDLTIPANRKSHLPWLRGTTTEKDGTFLLPNLRPSDYLIQLSLPESVRKAGYPAKEYYPGVAEVSMASSISVAEGAHMIALDIKLRRVPLVDFKGRLVDLGKDEASRPVEVAIDCLPGPISGSFERHSVDDGGRFHFERIPAGHHTLLIYRGAGHDDLPYSVEVDAGKDEPAVAVPAWVTLEGVVKSTAKAPWEGVFGVSLRGDGSWRKNVVPGDDGKFTLSAVPPGRWSLHFQSNNLHAGGRTLRIASVRAGAANVNGQPLVVTESGNPPIEILLSDQRGRIAGAVEEGEPKATQLVIVARPLGGSAVSDNEFVETEPDGSFLFADLLPGDYQLTAWALTESGQGIRGADCSNHAANVTVTDGQTTTIHLKRCNQ
jgi:hypothetical protein